ncbi:MAG: 2-hydroxyacyl-CoA dehydratase family protein [Firmicutes bacterium]|nr:2-hydroxyacyl-CoA dehydratase family protein [Bacillota bacterium]
MTELQEQIQAICGRLKNIMDEPSEALRQAREEKQLPLIGFLPTDVPEELIHAAGAQPWGLVVYDGALVSRADANLQTWACSLSRGSLGMALAGKLDHLNGLIIPHICDTTRMIAGIWKQNRPYDFMEDYILPRQADRPSAGIYLAGELNRLQERLAEFTGYAVTESDLRRSIGLYNSNRARLRELYQIHVRRPDLLGNLDVYSAIKSSMLIPKEKHNIMLEELLDVLQRADRETAAEENGGRVRVMVSGKLWEPPVFMEILDQSGMVCVADDLCTGYRYIANDVAESGDPVAALAERQLKRPPSPYFVNRAGDRLQYLVETVGNSGAAGVIFLHQKFCETENYDYPLLRDGLTAARIPNIRIESEIGNVSQGQISTRVQAFVEMLGGGEIYGSQPTL